MTGNPLRVALDEPDFRKLVGGEVVALETEDGQQVRLILSDIGWSRMLAAVAQAAAKREGPKREAPPPKLAVTRKIERLYAWIATEESGDEGVPAASSSMGPVPLIGADRDRIESFRELARYYQRQLGCSVRLVCFDHLVELERLLDG